jgi:phage baseplate assembly protein W
LAQNTRDRIAVLLTTAPGERPEDLTYGSSLRALAFAGIDDVENNVEDFVSEALQRYLPDVDIQSVDIQPIDGEPSQIQVTIQFLASDVETDFNTLIEG